MRKAESTNKLKTSKNFTENHENYVVETAER